MLYSFRALFRIAFFASVFLFSSSCSDNSPAEEKEEEEQEEEEVVKIDKLHLAGTGRGSNGNPAAMHWVNGAAKELEVDLSSGILYESAAYGMAVSGGDAYIAGVAHTSHGATATLWKNGKSTFLSSNHSQATEVVVHGSDVYVCGFESANNGYSYGVIWKNGVPDFLTKGNVYSQLMAIAIAGEDIYAVGNIVIEGKIYACIWKNGTPTQLTSSSYESLAYDLAISDNDVYVIGYEGDPNGASAMLWKNGVSQLFEQAELYSLRAIKVVNGDVYVAGNDNKKSEIGVWKNGVPLYFTPGEWIETYGLEIHGDNTYVVGSTGGIFALDLFAEATQWVNNASGTIVEKGQSSGKVLYISDVVFEPK